MMTEKYDIWVVDPHGRIPGESMGHLIGLEAAKYYASKGKKVLLITSTFSHILKHQRSDETSFLENDLGIDIVMLKASSYDKHIGFKRIIWHFTFCYSFLKNLKMFGRPEYITVSFPFPFFDLLIPYLKKKTGAKIALHYSDMWPEIFALALPKKIRPLSKYIFWPFFYMRNRALEACDGITNVSKSYDDFVAGISEKVKSKNRKVIYRSLVSLEDFKPISIDNQTVFDFKDEQLILNYSGTLGSGYDIVGLIDVLERIQNSQYKGKVKVFISGKGPYEEYVKQKQDELGRDVLEYCGVLDYKDLLTLYKVSNLGCLPYVSGTTIAFPAKVFDYIVAGTPVLHSIDGELRELTESNKCGIYYVAGDHDALFNEITALIDSPDEKLASMSHNMSKISDQYTLERNLEQLYEFYQTLVEKDDNAKA